MAKNMLAMQDTWVSSLGQEDPLEKGMATHSSILAWRIPQTEEFGGLQSMGSQRVTVTNTHTHTWVYVYVCVFTWISPTMDIPFNRFHSNVYDYAKHVRLINIFIE